jgi:hypothetical protein
MKNCNDTIGNRLVVQCLYQLRHQQRAPLPIASIKYYHCVCILILFIRHANRCATLSAVTCPSLPNFFHIISNTARFSKKKIIGYKMCVLIFDFTLGISTQIFNILSIIQRGSIRNTCWCSRKAPVILVRL